MSQDRPNGAAAAILSSPLHVSTRVPEKKGVVCGSFAAADTLEVIVRASFAPIHHSKQFMYHYTRGSNSKILLLLPLIILATEVIGAQRAEFYSFPFLNYTPKIWLTLTL